MVCQHLTYILSFNLLKSAARVSVSSPYDERTETQRDSETHLKSQCIS